ncbi:MAG: hypothetical protein NC213_08385 [Acetobacter sp.]|nr:hypothetical protein [Bacteroides sp.]MCM1341745.1 hypothetical protein [Acetobacter sp.]MCM1432316.1 hypothetical protein [Clostridiales bacterium]
MRDVNIGQNYGDVIENNYYGNEKNYSVDFELKETTVNDLIKSKTKELIGSLISIVISVVLDIINKSVEINNKLSIAFIVIMLIFGALGAIILFCYICDMIKILKLKTNGKCINFESKREVFQAIIETMREEDNISDEKAIGKLIKNENGKIYEIRGCACPICKSEPIGYMYPSCINKNGQYIFECDENQAHRLTFDYKNKIV